MVSAWAAFRERPRQSGRGVTNNMRSPLSLLIPVLPQLVVPHEKRASRLRLSWRALHGKVWNGASSLAV